MINIEKHAREIVQVISGNVKADLAGKIKERIAREKADLRRLLTAPVYKNRNGFGLTSIGSNTAKKYEFAILRMQEILKLVEEKK